MSRLARKAGARRSTCFGRIGHLTAAAQFKPETYRNVRQVSRARFRIDPQPPPARFSRRCPPAPPSPIQETTDNTSEALTPLPLYPTRVTSWPVLAFRLPPSTRWDSGLTAPPRKWFALQQNQKRVRVTFPSFFSYFQRSHPAPRLFLLPIFKSKILPATHRRLKRGFVYNIIFWWRDPRPLTYIYTYIQRLRGFRNKYH